jgi:hypothetical protein
VPLPAAWHVIFSAEHHEVQDFDIYVPLASARRHFSRRFLGLWCLLYARKEEIEQFRATAPPRSSEWRAIRGLFDLFGFDQYVDALRWLSGDLGCRSVLKLSYNQELAYSEDRVRDRALFLERNRQINQLLQAVSERDLVKVCRDPLLHETGEFGDSVYRWMMAEGCFSDISDFAQYIFTEDELAELPFYR